METAGNKQGDGRFERGDAESEPMFLSLSVIDISVWGPSCAL